MLEYNGYRHREFVARELAMMIRPGTFASFVQRSLGHELHYCLVDWPDASETEFSRLFPVDDLYLWVSRGDGLDPTWLADEYGNYLDDDGNEVPNDVKPTYSGPEQLAAYGLWLVSIYGSLGTTTEEGCNENGFTGREVERHGSECLLQGYQSLAYAQKLLLGAKLTAAETERASRIDFSSLGKKGAEKRHAPMVALRTWAIEKYKASEWPSANQAAHALKDSIIKHGRTINAHLTEENAQRTIAEWFRKSV